MFLCDQETKPTEIESETAIICCPVFVIVCTKMESFSNAIIDFHPNNADIQHLSDLDDLVNRVNSFQHLAMIENQLKSLKNHYLPQEISFELMDPNTKTKLTKYRIYVVDRQVETTKKFAAFVVPKGRLFT